MRYISSTVRGKDFNEKTGGICVDEDGENSELFKSAIRPILACIIPNRIPMQLRGPAKNENHFDA